ncbi:unnamed protein product [Peniophora sp. CBMAI 1063]|nr:unnamed protein product [Peniophora sp. CBMAI 1063]
MVSSPRRSLKPAATGSPHHTTKPSERERLEAELAAKKGGSANGKKGRSSLSSATKDRDVAGRKVNTGPKASKKKERAQTRYTVAWAKHRIITDKIVRELHNRPNARVAFGLDKGDNGEKVTSSGGKNQKDFAREIARKAFEDTQYAEYPPHKLETLVIGRIKWQVSPFTRLTRRVSHSVTSRLKTQYAFHRKELSETGHGLVEADQEHKIRSGSKIENAWNKISATFPWFKDMIRMMARSPSLKTKAVGNSQSVADLSVLTKKSNTQEIESSESSSSSDEDSEEEVPQSTIDVDKNNNDNPFVVDDNKAGRSPTPHSAQHSPTQPATPAQVSSPAPVRSFPSSPTNWDLGSSPAASGAMHGYSPMVRHPSLEYDDDGNIKLPATPKTARTRHTSTSPQTRRRPNLFGDKSPSPMRRKQQAPLAPPSGKRQQFISDVQDTIRANNELEIRRSRHRNERKAAKSAAKERRKLEKEKLRLQNELERARMASQQQAADRLMHAEQAEAQRQHEVRMMQEQIRLETLRHAGGSQTLASSFPSSSSSVFRPFPSHHNSYAGPSGDPFAVDPALQ